VVDIFVPTRRQVRERAFELAVCAGRAAHEVSKQDWDIAKNELASANTNSEAARISAARS